MVRRPPRSATRRPSRSPASWSTPASRWPGWTRRGPASRNCSWDSPGRDSMSTAELSAPRGDGALAAGDLLAGRARPRNGVRSWLRLLRSELRLMFRRWRNLALLGVLVVLPVVLGIGLRVSSPDGGGDGPNASFFAQLAGNGVFLSFLALTILLTLVLPLVIAVVSGDSVAGEAGLGTLRFLLTVPAGRTRLLSVKYAAVVIFGLAACLLVSARSLIMGAILFPIGPVALLSGTTGSLAGGLPRLLFVTPYVAAGVAARAPVGAAISAPTDHP